MGSSSSWKNLTHTRGEILTSKGGLDISETFPTITKKSQENLSFLKTKVEKHVDFKGMSQWILSYEQRL